MQNSLNGHCGWFCRNCHAIALVAAVINPALGAAVEAIGASGVFGTPGERLSQVYEPNDIQAGYLDAYVTNFYNPFYQKMVQKYALAKSLPDYLDIKSSLMGQIEIELYLVESYLTNHATTNLDANSVEIRMRYAETLHNALLDQMKMDNPTLIQDSPASFYFNPSTYAGAYTNNTVGLLNKLFPLSDMLPVDMATYMNSTMSSQGFSTSFNINTDTLRLFNTLPVGVNITVDNINSDYEFQIGNTIYTYPDNFTEATPPITKTVSTYVPVSTTPVSTTPVTPIPTTPVSTTPVPTTPIVTTPSGTTTPVATVTSTTATPSATTTPTVATATATTNNKKLAVIGLAIGVYLLW